ncbi:hypothetical protein A9Q77_12185 [Marinomonas sp. 42_23_T18]|nr:hypothetical protein A9Q77_12185 [Marinomonas sp. 42_23_T18]
MSLITLAGLKAVEHSINLALVQDAPSQQKLNKLAGQQILLEVDDFNLLIVIQILEQGLALSLPSDVEDAKLDNRLDTHVRGPSSAYRKLLEGDGFFDGDLRIQGNAQTLMTLHKVSANFELDWEGILADKIGDMATSFIAPLLRSKWQWGKHAAQSFKLNLVEYLQEEADLLPSKLEFNNFVEDLEMMETALDRLDARMRFLNSRK